MIRLALTVLALSLPLAVPASAQSSADLVVKESKLSVKDTIDQLAKALEAKGVKVVARVDHAAGAKAANMELQPTELLIFGNPQLGTPLMQSNPLIGIDLPMKALAYTDASGKVMLAYIKPDVLKARYSISDKDAAFKAMAGALEAFSTAATAAK